MTADELSAPLGQERRAKQRLPLLTSIFPAFLAVFGMLALLTAAWVLVADDRFGAERIAPAAPAHSVARSPEGRPADGGGPAAQVVGGSSYEAQVLRTPSAAPPSSRTVTIIDGSSGKRQEIVLPDAASLDALDQLSGRTTAGDGIAHVPRERSRPSNSPDLP
jgi:uncharacterized protein